MASNVLELGREVSLDHLINGKTGLEAEVVFWLDKDLPGPTVTREDVIEATAEVAGAVELIAPRVAAYGSESLTVPAGGEQPISDWPNRHNHGIIDNVWHIGVIFGSNRVGVDEVDFMNERVSLAVNDETIVEGRFSWTLGRDPIQGVVWLANELLNYGYQLSAGDFVITGSVAYTESVFPGDRATLTYSSLGTIDMSVASTP
jgi:2-keto-4-pentenoate hydratase